MMKNVAILGLDMTKINKMILVMGDWSDDGHCHSDNFGFEANKTVEEIQAAYKQSCKTTGISFNHNEDYTERDYDYSIKKHYYAATNYMAPFVYSEFYATCVAFDCPYLDRFYQAKYQMDTVYMFDNADSFRHFIDMWWWFVKLSLPDLEYDRSDTVLVSSPTINGYWNDGLNVQFGYGLYDA